MLITVVVKHMSSEIVFSMIRQKSFTFTSPSPIPEFNKTPQENHMAEDKVRASSSSSSLFTLNLPNGLGKSGQTVKMIRKRVGKVPI